jgi:hypothetical protein
MTSPDPDRAWALFMSDPADFIAMFAVVAGTAFGCAWWLRHFIGKERIATLEERLKFAKDKYDTSTAEVQRLNTYASRLDSDVAKLLGSPLPGSRLQVDAVVRSSALVAKTVTSLSTANNELGVALSAGSPELGSPDLKTTSIKPSA